MNLFAQLDWDRQYRAVRRAPIRAYEGWHFVPEPGLLEPLSPEDLREIANGRRKPPQVRHTECISCHTPLLGKKRRFCSEKCADIYGRFRDTPPPPQTCGYCREQFLKRKASRFCGQQCRDDHERTLWDNHQRREKEREAAVEAAAFEERRCKWALLDAIPHGGSLTTTIPLSFVQRWANTVGDATVYAVGPGLLLVIRDSKDKMPDCLQ